MKVYLAGSLRNENMLHYRETLQEAFPDHEIFMDWYAAGPLADDHWKSYWTGQGVDYKEALSKPNSQNTFQFDKKHIDSSDILILAAPAGKSGHMELGYALGSGKIGLYFFPEEEDVRWDVMLNFSTAVCVGMEDLMQQIHYYSQEEVRYFAEQEMGIPVLDLFVVRAHDR